MDALDQLKEENAQLKKDKSTLEGEKKDLVKDLNKATGAHSDLVKKHEALTIAHGALTTENTRLLTNFNTLELASKAVTDQYEALKNTHTSLLDESSLEIGRLSKELSAVKTDADNGIRTVTVGNQKYQVIGKIFNIEDRGELTIEQIKNDKDLLKKLVEQGAGFLVPVTQ